MEPLPRLKARLANLHELQSLIRALRAMAASHVQEAQSALLGVLSYVAAIEDAIAEGVGLLEAMDGGAAAEGAEAGVLIVCCTEQGFVGALNERLLDRAEAELAGPRPCRLAVAGQRGALLAQERGMSVAWTFPMATHVGGVLALTRDLAHHLGSVSRARVVYGAYRPGGDYSIEAQDILPLDPALLARAGPRRAPLHHLPPDLLMRRLASEYLFAELTRAVMQALASENGARLRVMEAADRNIDDKLGSLTQLARSQRQEAITAELLEVITGAEAVMGPPS